MTEPLKGFREFFPEELAPRRVIIDTLEDTAQRYGFREIATPALERTQLYIEKSGEEIVDELYHFTDRGNREVALTPELTPTVARMVVQRGQELSKPIKWYSTRPFWRYEQVQQGRFREFYQTNVDIFGTSDPFADAEILAWAADSLTALELTSEEFVFRISHRDVLGELLQSVESTVSVREAIRAVDKRERIERDAYLQLLQEAGLSPAEAQEFDELIADVDTVEDLDALTAFAGEPIADAVENLTAVLEATEKYGVREYCELSLTTARGLDYYTGVVFECFDSVGEVSRSVFGGGRYDELIESVGGPSIPAVGVAPGVMNSTLPLLLQRAGVWPEDVLTTDYYVLTVGDTRAVATQIVRELRGRGHTVETDLADRSFGGQLEYADSIGAETVVIVGEQDLADDAVTIKDMQSGEQVQVPLSDFPSEHHRPTYEEFASD